MKKKKFLAILSIAACILTVSTTQVLAQEKVSVFNEIYDFSVKMEEKCPDVSAAFSNLQNSIIYKEGALSIKGRSSLL